MYLLYNRQLILEKDLMLPLTNRAFQYNDGFFETVMVIDGRLRFWHDHIARMQEAALSLSLNLPSLFMQPNFEQELLQLAEKNGVLTYGRLKLKVWRSGAGLYTPTTNDVEWIATAEQAAPVRTKSINIGICQNIKTIYSTLSHFKGPNALLYVLAGSEKKQTEFDDMLLLDIHGMVAELISSNIFWLRNDKLYTPALDTGCINGIIRRNIIRWCKDRSIKVQEAYFTPERLLDADAVFAANVTGIRSIKSINGQFLKKNQNFLKELQEELMK